MVQQVFLLTGHTPDELTLAAVQYLVGRGYAVEDAGEWETRSAFCGRLGISVSRFKRQMGMLRYCPRAPEVQTGPTGRLVRLKSNAPFDRWMKGPT